MTDQLDPVRMKMDLVELASAVRMLAAAVRQLGENAEAHGPIVHNAYPGDPGEGRWAPADTARSVSQTVDRIFHRWGVDV